MFHNIPTAIYDRMKYLESIDARDRIDGTHRLKRLRQIPPETGQFIALLAANSPAGAFIEIGTSGGYSTLWLILAGMERSVKITTFEILDEKIRIARETFSLAQVEDYVHLIAGDALDSMDNFDDIAFCFLDAEKEIYLECYKKVVPRMVPSGILIVDNAINQRQAVQPMLDKALRDDRVDSLIVPIGKGVLVCRRNPG